MFLRYLSLQNVRSIENLEIDFCAGRDLRKWTLLLGENGTGKSTILRSIALLMAGGEAFGELFATADEWVRLGTDEAVLRAEVAVGTESRSIELKLRRGEVLRKTFTRNEAQLNELDQLFRDTPRALMTVGFGVSRRIGAATHGERYRTARANRVGTLFSPAAELFPLEAWATDVHYRFEAKGLETVEDTLVDLLPGVRFTGIDRHTRQLSFQVPEGRVPFSQLSDGYQNVAGWIGDLLYRISDEQIGVGSLLKASGLLLLDEMDLHLHPIWQRKLRDFLDAKLPGFQIIGTTHSPLTAHQAGAGELHVLRRMREHAPPRLFCFPGEPRKLMLHQLVMSPMFGLGTVDSAEVESWKNEYRTLRRISPVELSKAQRDRLAFLEEQLRDMPDWSIESDREREQRLALERVTHLLTHVQSGNRTPGEDEPVRRGVSTTLPRDTSRSASTRLLTTAAGTPKARPGATIASSATAKTSKRSAAGAAGAASASGKPSKGAGKSGRATAPKKKSTGPNSSPTTSGSKASATSPTGRASGKSGSASQGSKAKSGASVRNKSGAK